MKLHDLAPPKGATKPKQRVGRGTGGKGHKTAGRGTKGQHARNTVPAGFEGGQLPLMQRIPKLKGFKNPFRVAYTPVNIGVLAGLGTAEIARAFAGWENGEVDVRIVANRGRDIAPKLTAYGDLRDRYDLVLYLHSKRHISRNPDGSVLNDGSDWRRYLLHTLAGSPAIVGSILEAFHRDPRLGIVMAQHWEPVRDWINWADNFFVARNLARRMGVRLTPGHAIDFPSGSMFWARPATLGPILDLGLRAEDFPGEADQEEGTVAHAVERLFLFACEAAGYRWAKVCDPVESTYPGAVIRIDTPEALYAYHRRYGFRLTALGPP